MLLNIKNESDFLKFYQTALEIEQLCDKLRESKYFSKINEPLIQQLLKIKASIIEQLKIYEDEQEPRIGDWMSLNSGERFWPLDPRPEDINIETIAHSLSMQCRFAGHCDRFYPVSAHCIFVSNIVPKEFALYGLLHDAAEAYMQDIIRPLKEIPQIHEVYYPIEQKIMDAVLKKFSLHVTEECASIVKRADNDMCETEMRTFFPGRRKNIVGNFVEHINIDKQYIPEICKQEFLNRFNELYETSL